MTCIFTSIKNHEGKVVDSKNENELLSINGLCFFCGRQVLTLNYPKILKKRSHMNYYDFRFLGRFQA